MPLFAARMLPALGRQLFPAISNTLLVTFGLAAAPAPLPAEQQPTGMLVGHLVDRQSGTAIAGASLIILGWSLEAGSDSFGRFTYTGLRPGNYMLQARAVGYTVTNWVVKLGEAEEQHRTFRMAPLAVELEPVTVKGQPTFAEQRRQEFEQRRAVGRGYFITAQEIERVNASTIGQVLRNVPGIRAICNSAGCTMRIARSPRNCLPEYFVDGLPATNSTTAQLPTVGIIGIEVYRSVSETPQQFLKSDAMCGVVVIWTRSGPGQAHN